MKKTIWLLPLLLLALTSCGTISNVTGAVQTPAQLEAEVCTPLKAALAVLTPATAQLTPNMQAVLVKASRLEAALCSGTPAVFLSDLNTLPGILNLIPQIVNATNLPNSTKLDINLGVGAAAAAMAAIQAQTPSPALSSSVTAVQATPSK